ncbi:MAG: DUF1203 domain-containing protein [Sphingomonadales bacterium]|nr:MAG: DUF1203 domain-containing protein [Sphingomonadales bacterium]
MREGAEHVGRFVDAVPEQLARRMLSVRAYDRAGMMTDAEVTDGTELGCLIGSLFVDPAVAYLHVHNARRGCFAARVDRF